MRRIMIPYAARSETPPNSSHPIALLGHKPTDISRNADNGHKSHSLPAKQEPQSNSVAHAKAISPIREVEPATVVPSFRWLRDFIRRLTGFLSRPPQGAAFRTSPLSGNGYRWNFEEIASHDPHVPTWSQSNKQTVLAGAGRQMSTTPSEPATQHLTPRLENSVQKALEQHLQVRLTAAPQSKQATEATPNARGAPPAISQSKSASVLIAHIK